MTDRTPTAPDIDGIERAALRLRGTAALLDKLADAFGTTDFAEALDMISDDLMAAHETFQGAINYIIESENRSVAA